MKSVRSLRAVVVSLREAAIRARKMLAADVANIFLARIAASRNDTTTARKLLTDFISDHPKHLLVGAARYSLYQIRIGNGEAPQVVIELNAELAKTTDQGQMLPPDTLLALLA